MLTDIRMPPISTDEGIRLAADLSESSPDTGVVVLSQYVEPAYAVALLEKGSARRAYLLKKRVSDIDQLVDAIRSVADGLSVIDPAVVDASVRARFVLVAQPSLFDDTRAPVGHHTLWAYCHVPNGSTVDMADRITAQIERFAPGSVTRSSTST